jgi:hypothetical protein
VQSERRPGPQACPEPLWLSKKKPGLSQKFWSPTSTCREQNNNKTGARPNEPGGRANDFFVFTLLSSRHFLLRYISVAGAAFFVYVTFKLPLPERA